jgi:hypothetical protein
VSGPGSTARVWRQAAAIVGRYPAATVISGAVMGAIAEAPRYFAGDVHPRMEDPPPFASVMC